MKSNALANLIQESTKLILLYYFNRTLA